MTASFVRLERRGAGRRLPYEGGEIGSLPGAGASMTFKNILVTMFLIRFGIGVFRDLTKPRTPPSEHRPFTKDRPLGTLTGGSYFSDSFNALF